MITTDFCISQYLFGNSQHVSPDHFSKKKKWLNFRDILRKILYLLARRQMHLDGLIFIINVLQWHFADSVK